MTVRGSAYGNMLIAARRAAGLSQMEVAKRVGVAQSTYSKWEKRVVSAIETGKLGPRQARVLLDLLEEIAPERKPE